MFEDKKVLTYLLKGSPEFNNVRRMIDISTLGSALEPDFFPIFKIINTYFMRYGSPPPMQLLRDEASEDIDQMHLINLIEEDTCEDNEIGYYVDKIRDRKNAVMIRKLVDSFYEMDNMKSIEEFNGRMAKTMSSIERLRKSSVFSEGDFRKTPEDRYNKYLFAKENPDQIAGIFSGYKELDDMTFGIKNSELMIIAGASSSGKSMLMMNMAINAWRGSNRPDAYSGKMINNGKNIIYFTLEMSKEQLEQRIDANIAKIRHRNLVRGKLDDSEMKRYVKSLEFQKNYDKNLYIVDLPRGSKTIDIEARFDAVCAEFQPDLICVDYLQLMKPNTSFGQDWLDLGYVAEDLHEFCRKKNIPVITAAQRKAKNKANKKQYNDMEEVGRSKMITDNANIALLIANRDDEHLMEDMEIHIAKNRDGAKGKFSLLKDFERSRIDGIPDDWINDPGEENEV